MAPAASLSTHIYVSGVSEIVQEGHLVAWLACILDEGVTLSSSNLKELRSVYGINSPQYFDALEEASSLTRRTIISRVWRLRCHSSWLVSFFKPECANEIVRFSKNNRQRLLEISGEMGLSRFSNTTVRLFFATPSCLSFLGPNEVENIVNSFRESSIHQQRELDLFEDIRNDTANSGGLHDEKRGEEDRSVEYKRVVIKKVFTPVCFSGYIENCEDMERKEIKFKLHNLRVSKRGELLTETEILHAYEDSMQKQTCISNVDKEGVHSSTYVCDVKQVQHDADFLSIMLFRSITFKDGKCVYYSVNKHLLCCGYASIDWNNEANYDSNVKMPGNRPCAESNGACLEESETSESNYVDSEDESTYSSFSDSEDDSVKTNDLTLKDRCEQTPPSNPFVSNELIDFGGESSTTCLQLDLQNNLKPPSEDVNLIGDLKSDHCLLTCENAFESSAFFESEGCSSEDFSKVYITHVSNTGEVWGSPRSRRGVKAALEQLLDGVDDLKRAGNLYDIPLNSVVEDSHRKKSFDSLDPFEIALTETVIFLLLDTLTHEWMRVRVLGEPKAECVDLLHIDSGKCISLSPSCGGPSHLLLHIIPDECRHLISLPPLALPLHLKGSAPFAALDEIQMLRMTLCHRSFEGVVDVSKPLKSIPSIVLKDSLNGQSNVVQDLTFRLIANIRGKVQKEENDIEEIKKEVERKLKALENYKAKTSKWLNALIL
eukprot:Nk52_evm4s2596 gene=Nk52_evmTU4s2596